MLITNMSLTDVGRLVRVHQVVFAGYNATVAGEAYLKSLYHTLAVDSSCLSVVAWEDGQVVGWIGGVKDWSSFVRAVTWRCMPRIFSIILAMLRTRPRLLLKASSYVVDGILGLIRSYIIRPETEDSAPAVNEAALLVIGVVPDRQKKGLAQSMMEHFEGQLLVDGFNVCTSTTHVGNDAGNRAFRKAGYRLTGTHGVDNRYMKRLSQKGTPAVPTHSNSTG